MGGGGGGGGRGNNGNPGNAGNSGANANNTTFNCQTVSGSYPISIAPGGQMVINWNPQ
jgi:hypothetical protein